MAKLKSLTDLRFSTPFSPFNPFCNGLRRFRVAPLALLLAVGVGWSAPAASAQAVNFGSVNVCPSGATTPAPCSKTLAVSFTVPASGTLGTPEVFTQGASNLDFTLASGSTCVGTVTEGATCAVNVTFTPLAPGERNGGVQIVDGSGNVLANAYIYGTGVGPVIAFSPSPQTTLGSGFADPNGVTVDDSGNVFVADSGNNAVKEIMAVNGSVPANPTIKTLSSGFNYPAGVAVDGSGNVFVADVGNNAVKEILAVNGSIPANPTIRTLTLTAGPNSYNGGLAVDESGNVFVAPNQALEEILAVNGSIPANPTIRTFASNFVAELGGVAVDGSENVFFADFGNSSVYEILAVNGSIPANPTVNTLLPSSTFPDSAPDGVAVDGAGDVFYADSTFGKVYEILAVDGSIPVNPIINTLASGFSFPAGAAVDGSGDVFVADESNNRVVEIQRSQPPSLSFVATAVSSISSDSPQSIQIQNIGNAPMTGNGVLSDTVDFVTVAGPGIVPDCTYGLSLAPGVECNVSFDFTPQSVGPLSATLTLSDKAPNGNPATQTISLSGIGVNNPNGPRLAMVSTTKLEFGTIVPGNTESLSLTITNIGGGTLTVSPSIGGPSYTISGSTCTGGLTHGNSCTLQVQFSPVTIGSYVGILTLQTNGATNPTVTLHGQGGVPAASAQAVNFGSVNVCSAGATTPAPCNKTLAVSFTVPASGTLGTPKVLTLGAPNLDFTLASGSTCVGAITEGATCSVNVTFAPRFAGGRKGGVEIVDGSGNVLADAPVYGIGSGPQMTFQPTLITFAFMGGPGINTNLAVDGSGNIFVSNDSLYEIVAAAGYTTKTLSANFNNPFGVAVDGSGNVFVADSGNETVQEILAAGGYTTVKSVAAIQALGLAVDGSGNLFVGNAGNESVQEILAAGDYTTVNTLAGGQGLGRGIALDASGNVFATPASGGSVVEILAAGGYTTANTLLGSEGPDLWGVAVDASGNVFAAEFGTDDTALYEIPYPAGYTTFDRIPLVAPYPSVTGVAVDGSRNVYYAAGVDNAMSIMELDYADPPSVGFPTTYVGSTATAQTVSVWNSGNQPLIFATPATGHNPDYSEGFPENSADASLCTAGLTLAPNAGCDVSMKFRPSATGPLTGSVTLSYNGYPGTQTISLSGIGVINPNGPHAFVTPTTLEFGAIAFGGSAKTLPLLVGNIGGGTLTVSPSIGGPSYTISGSTCTGGLTAGNSCTLQVQFSPITIGSHVDMLTVQTNGTTGTINPIVTLHGKATGVGVKTEGSLEFGTIAFGTTKVLPLTITNIGVPGTVTVGTKIGGPSYKVLTNAQNTCLAGIGPGQSCTLPIEFDPVSVGMHDDILTLTPSGGAAPSTPHLDGFAN